MRSADEVMRVQARVLLRVFRGYRLEQPRDVDTAGIWQDVEAYGNSSPQSVTLRRISARFKDAVRRTAVKGKSFPLEKHAALWALHAFCCEAPAQRFQMPSYWAAVILAGRRPRSTVRHVHAEVYEKLEDAFDEEMFPKEVA